MNRRYLLVLVVTMSACALATSLQAESVVIENRGEHTFYYSLRTPDGAAWSQAYHIASGEKQSHVATERLKISYLSDGAQFAWLDANKTYRISDVAQGRLRAVTQVRRPALPAATPDAATPDAASPDAASPDAASPDAGRPSAAASAANDAPQLSDPSTATTDSTKEAESESAGDASAAETAAPAASPTSLPTSPSPAPAESTSPGESGITTSPQADQSDDTFDGLFDITNRVVTVRAITDNTYRNAFPEWRERVRRTIDGASEYFQREYAIRLIVTETSEWDYNAVNDTLETRWSRLLKESPHDVDLIIALVGFGDYSRVDGEAKFTGQLGRARLFGQHLIVADRQDYHVNRAKTILIHELGHIFGAFHVADQNLMMYPGYLELPTEKIIEGTVPFGDTIDAVFAMTKGFAFRDGVASLSPRTQHQIQSLYRQHGLATESRQTDPITSGYEYLEQRAKIVAEQMAKRATEARGVFDGLSE